MKAKEAAALLINIAARNVGNTEDTPNRAPWIKPLWPETSYPEGFDDRAPYCAAGMCWTLANFVRGLAQVGELRATLGMGLSDAERWRCKSAGAFRWRDWARDKGLHMEPDTGKPAPGDFVVYDFSHIGLVAGVAGSQILTVEYNTNAQGSRDGDGCWRKSRNIKLAQCFIRLPWQQ